VPVRLHTAHWEWSVKGVSVEFQIQGEKYEILHCLNRGTGGLSLCSLPGPDEYRTRSSINLIAEQVGNPTAVATSRGGLPIIGPREQTDQRRGLGIGQQGLGTTIGQEGTAQIEPAMVPDFGLTASQGASLTPGQQGFATALNGPGTALLSPGSALSSGSAPGFVGRRGLGLIGPQTAAPTAVGSQIIALAINAQNSTLTIGAPGIGNAGNGRLNTITPLQQTRVFTVPGIPHTAFAGRTVTVTRGH
jgi:hypothetical protein